MIMSEDIELQIINEGLVPGNLDKINSGSQNNNTDLLVLIRDEKVVNSL